MSEDYYLKQVYNKIFTDKRFKSNYKTLSESYDSVYESADSIPFPVHELKLDLVPWNIPQQSLYRLTAGKIKPTKARKELTPSEIESNAEAEADLVAVKNGVVSGLGPGEYAVASVISGSTDPAELANLISGQSMSYDVSWPSSDPRLAKYKFEVKLEGDVRIGAQGAALGNKIKEALKNVLSQIHDEYSLLEGVEKDTANTAILNRIKLKDIKAHVPINKRKGEGETSESIKKRLKHEAEVASREAKKAGWTVEGYIHAILANLNELPLALISGSEYEYINYKANTQTEINRNKYLITPLLSFLKAIDSFHGEVNVNKHGAEEEDTQSVKAIKNVLHHYYGVEDSESSPEINKTIDIEAHKVDRKLSRTKLSATREGVATFSDFFKAIKKLHLTREIEDIGEYMSSSEALRGCFPEDITGLFVVNPNGYRYVPENKIGESIKLVSISQGKPKVELKKSKE